MGTNFYADFKVARVSPWNEPYHELVTLHLGKRSAGWRFSWRGYREHEDFTTITTVVRWREVLQIARTIRDEYGHEYTPDDFIAMAVEWPGKSHAAAFPSDDNWHDGAHSFSGSDFC